MIENPALTHNPDPYCLPVTKPTPDNSQDPLNVVPQHNGMIKISIMKELGEFLSGFTQNPNPEAQSLNPRPYSLN